MTFPQSERVVYEVHTLNQVVCQLQFPPILAIGAEPPTTFQDRIRGDYPLYQRQDAMPLPPEVAGFLSNMPVKPPQSVLHQFGQENQKRGITLAPEFVAVTDNDYDEWGVLRPEIERVQQTLEAIYQPAFYSRIGLRYQDVIDRDALGLGEHEWRELLDPALLNLLGTDNDRIRAAVSESVSNVLVGLDHPDGALVRIQHGLATHAEGRTVYLIDADYYTDRRQEGRDVLGILDYFRKEAGNLFRWAISPLLADALGRREERTAAAQ